MRTISKNHHCFRRVNRIPAAVFSVALILLSKEAASLVRPWAITKHSNNSHNRTRSLAVETLSSEINNLHHKGSLPALVMPPRLGVDHFLQVSMVLQFRILAP